VDVCISVSEKKCWLDSTETIKTSQTHVSTQELLSTGENMERILYTVNEFRGKIIPMSRSKMYSEINKLRLQTVKIGSRRYISKDAISEYVALLESETSVS